MDEVDGVYECGELWSGWGVYFSKMNYDDLVYLTSKFQDVLYYALLLGCSKF